MMRRVSVKEGRYWGVYSFNAQKVRFQGQTGRYLLILSPTAFDPERTLRLPLGPTEFR